MLRGIKQLITEGVWETQNERERWIWLTSLIMLLRGFNATFGPGVCAHVGGDNVHISVRNGRMCACVNVCEHV